MSSDITTTDHGVNNNVVDLQADSNITIHKAVKNRDNPYAQIRKSVLSNQELSWEAKGLMSYLLGMPDNWTIHPRELATHSSNGRDKVFAIIKELMFAGYMTRSQEKDSRGLWTPYKYMVHEVPVRALKSVPNPRPEKPDAESIHPRPEKPRPEIPSLLKIDLQTDIDLKNNNNSQAPVVVEEVNILYESIKSYGVIRGAYDSWVTEHGYNYVHEKVVLALERPRKTLVGFLVDAMRLDWKPTVSNEEPKELMTAKPPERFTREKNLAWFGRLSQSEKSELLKTAQLRHHMVPSDIFPGDKNHAAWFEQFMELIGRPEVPRET